MGCMKFILLLAIACFTLSNGSSKEFDKQEVGTINPIGPFFLDQMSSVTVMEQSQALFFCEVMANPYPTFRWTINGMEIQERQRRFHILQMEKGRIGSILKIAPVINKDNGSLIECSVDPHNKENTITTQAKLIILSNNEVPSGFPHITHEPRRKVVEFKTPFTLSCEAKGEPRPYITWLKDFAPIPFNTPPAGYSDENNDIIHWNNSFNNDDAQQHISNRWNRYKLMRNGLLLVENSDFLDEGEYQCMATNIHGSVYSKSVAKIGVRERRVPPRFSIKPPAKMTIPKSNGNKSYLVDEPKQIVCVAIGSPMPLVRWKVDKDPDSNFENVILNNEEDIDDNLRGRDDLFQNFYQTFKTQDSNETIYDPKMDLYGKNPFFGAVTIGKNILRLPFDGLSRDINFTCVAISKLGTLTASTMIIVKDLPSSPSYLDVINMSSRSISIKWERVINLDESLDFSNITYHIQVFEQNLTREDWASNSIDDPLTNFVKIRSLKSRYPSIVIKHLKPFTDYQLRIRTVIDYGAGPWSTPLNFKTLEDVPESPPSEIKIRPMSLTEISIKWDIPSKPNGPILAYIIYYIAGATFQTLKPFEIPGKSASILAHPLLNYSMGAVPLLDVWTKLTITHTDQSRLIVFTIKGLKPLTLYTIKMQAVNSKGVSPMSESLSTFTSVLVPSEIPKFTGTPLSPSSITLSWDKNLDFHILRFYYLAYHGYSPDQDSQQKSIKINHPDILSYTLSNLTPDTMYTIFLIPASDTHCGIPSQPLLLRTPVQVARITSMSKSPPIINLINVSSWFKLFVDTINSRTVKVTLKIVKPISFAQISQLNSLTLHWKPRDGLPDNPFSRIVYVKPIIEIANSHSLMNASLLDQTINGLKPGTIYVFSYTFELLNNINNRNYGTNPIAAPSDMVELQTPEDVPGEPQNVTVKVLNSSSIEVFWFPPLEEERNGQIMGYLLNYREVNSKGKHIGIDKQITIPHGTTQSAILSELKPDTFYKIKVAAFTRKGDGYPSNPQIKKTFGGVPSSPTLSLRLLEEDPELIIQAEWTRPQITYGTLMGYRLLYRQFGGDDKNASLVKSPMSIDIKGGDIYYYNIENLERGQIYEFMLSALNERGYGKTISKIYTTPEGKPRKPPVNLLYEFLTPAKLLVSWERNPDIKSYGGKIIMNEVAYTLSEKMYNDDFEQLFNTSNFNYTLNDLTDTTYIAIKVRYYTIKGSSPWSQSIKIYLSEKASTPVNNVRIYATTPTSISVNWNPPLINIDESNNQTSMRLPNHILSYLIFYGLQSHMHDYRDWNVVNIPTNMLEFDESHRYHTSVTLLQPLTEYAVQIAPLTTKGLGITSQLIKVKTDPIDMPANLELRYSDNQILVSWDPPNYITLPITGYEITYQGRKTFTESNGTKTHLSFSLQHLLYNTPNITPRILQEQPANHRFTTSIRNLEPFTNYTVKVFLSRNISISTSTNNLPGYDFFRNMDRPGPTKTIQTAISEPASFTNYPRILPLKRNTSNSEKDLTYGRVIWFSLPRTSERYGPISHYIVIVVPKNNRYMLSSRQSKRNAHYTQDIPLQELIMSQDSKALNNPYIAALLTDDSKTLEAFPLGDNNVYNGFLNRYLEPNTEYSLFVRAFTSLEPFNPNIVRTDGAHKLDIIQMYPLYTSSPLSQSISLSAYVRGDYIDIEPHAMFSSSHHGKDNHPSAILNHLQESNDEYDTENGIEVVGKHSNIVWADNGKRSTLNGKGHPHGKNGRQQLYKPMTTLIVASISLILGLFVMALTTYYICTRRKNRKRQNYLAKANVSTNTSLTVGNHHTGLRNGSIGNRPLPNNYYGTDSTKRLLTGSPNPRDSDRDGINNRGSYIQFDDTVTSTPSKLLNGQANNGFKKLSLLISNNATNTQQSNSPDQAELEQLLSTDGLKSLGATVFSNNKANYDFIPPIKYSRLASHIDHFKENNNQLFKQEYQAIDPKREFSSHASFAPYNKLKNRYANVVAYDHSRVILNYSKANSIPENTHDYINANYIDGFNKKRAYIATQGPLPETLWDFWRMIWQQKSHTIVMLTKLEERNRIKCDKYWPDRGSVDTYEETPHQEYSTLGSQKSNEEIFQNVLVDSLELATYTIRTFCLMNVRTKEKREIKQFQYTAWPDHGVPEYPTPFLNFVKRVRASNPNDAGPIVIHCSAGVGRTGTYIVVDIALDQLESIRNDQEFNDATNNTNLKENLEISVFEQVTKLRCQRNFMVQTVDQYIFIYDCILEGYETGNTEISAIDLFGHIQTLESLLLNKFTPYTQNSDFMLGIEREFKNISKGIMQSHGQKFVHATEFVNKRKNRQYNILPYEYNRVYLSPLPGIEGSDYINASFIDGYKEKNAYIATQGPLPETINDFWRMLWEHNSNIIVMLTQINECGKAKCAPYWPVDGPMRYGRYIVEPVAEYSMPQYILREFKITDTKPANDFIMNATLRRQQRMTTTAPRPPNNDNQISAFQTANSPNNSLGFEGGDHHNENMPIFEDIMAKSMSNTQEYGMVNSSYCNNGLYSSAYSSNSSVIGSNPLNYIPSTSPSRTIRQFHFDCASNCLDDFGGTLPHRNHVNHQIPLTPHHNTLRHSTRNLMPLYPSSERLQLNDFMLQENETDFENMINPKHRTTTIGGGTTSSVSSSTLPHNHHSSSSSMLLLSSSKSSNWPSPITLLTTSTTSNNTHKGVVVPSSWKEQLEENFLELIGQVHKTKDQFGADGPITVHCSNGAGLTGAFLAISITVHRMKYESKVDLAQTVRWLRQQRPGMIQTLNQYRFCYKAALQYLKSFDMYAP